VVKTQQAEWLTKGLSDVGDGVRQNNEANIAALCLCVVALVCASVGTHVQAAEPEPLSPAITFRFMGGERIKLIVVPETVGTSLEQIVTDDGFIAMPTGGEPLNIKNKSRAEAQKLAAERIQKDSGVMKATADIALLSVPARSVFIGGEGVRTSQSIPIVGSSPLTLYAALLSAGGISADADPTRVSVSHTAADGSVKTEMFDVSQFGEPASKSLGPVLEAGDVVKVPRGEVFILAGEVVRAGPVNKRDPALRSDAVVRVSQVIYATGGLKPGANRKAVKIIRQSKDGKRQTLAVDLDAAEKPAGPVAAKSGADVDPVLQDGDIVVVGATGGITVLGKVRVPGVYPVGGQTIKLTKVIATAGGWAEFAKTNALIIVRASNPQAPMHVDMSLIQKGSFQDVELEEGDLVYVPEKLL